MKNLALFASGNGTNVQRIAEYFADSADIRIKLIVCNNPKAYVLVRSKNLGIETFLIKDKESFFHSNEVLEILQQHNIDLIVLAGFLWLIPNNLIEAYPDKIINLHPALLPKYGGKGMYGMHVHEAVVANGETETGITIHYVNQCYDEGKIIFQAKCNLSPDDTAEDVARKIHALEYEHFPEVIEKVFCLNHDYDSDKKKKTTGNYCQNIF
jgi:phosphoribosylglycinamide formyltransferase-1